MFSEIERSIIDGNPSLDHKFNISKFKEKLETKEKSRWEIRNGKNNVTIPMD